MESGLSRSEAQAVIEAEGRAMNLLKQQRDLMEARQLRAVRDELKRRMERLYPTQPSKPRSVKSFPTAFESNRRRH
jgi:nitrate reductase cytochrome c-type subunit